MKICKPCLNSEKVCEIFGDECVQSNYVGALRAWGKKVTNMENCHFSNEWKMGVITTLDEFASEDVGIEIKKIMNKQIELYHSATKRERDKMCKPCRIAIDKYKKRLSDEYKKCKYGSYLEEHKCKLCKDCSTV